MSRFFSSGWLEGFIRHAMQFYCTEFSGRYRSYGLKVGGGRTRIRTRVFGLEGQSDIQLHYTSLIQARGSHLMKFNHCQRAQSGLAHL